METTITMSSREQHRAWVLTKILKGELTMAEGAARLAISARQLWRLRTAYERDGPAGLVHRNRGRASPRRIDPDLVARIVELHRTMYGPLNDSHFAELLAEDQGIRLSRESIRAILRTAGIASARRRRPPKYRSRRPRMAAEGMLLQLDGSRHDWLEGRGPALTLLGAIDDATGRVVAATFRDQEDAAGYLEILRQVVAGHGIPEAIYRDRHGAFEPTSPRRSTDDEPGRPGSLSQVGRALVELGIDSIPAASAQAKGRVERLWGTCQDRLIVELRLAGVVDRDGANIVLAAFVARFNGRFAVPPADPVPAWRAVPAEVRVERVLVFKYRRKIARDHTIRLDGTVLQLPRGSGPSNHAGKLVEVHVGLDGSVVVFDGERRLLAVPAPPDPVQLRAQNIDRALPGLVPAPATLPWIPPRDHPWKRVSRTSKLYQRLTDSLGS
jgi:transposase